MIPVLIGDGLQVFFGLTMTVCSVFLILLVLVQRGRGGGLAGAFGGMGGQSAFGTKAGDLFTKVTMVTATAWILLCLGALYTLSRRTGDERFGADAPEPGLNLPAGEDQIAGNHHFQAAAQTLSLDDGEDGNGAGKHGLNHAVQLGDQFIHHARQIEECVDAHRCAHVEPIGQFRRLAAIAFEHDLVDPKIVRRRLMRNPQRNH